ncbi:hypothetical protein RUM44_005606 [Polyplax serrata]|uniref:Uncharacterized protein n=1 Tax=Polyplax serrata TaxID=468196 RepID=A0ABR1ADV4_POLSC
MRNIFVISPTEIYLPPKTTISPKSNNNIHLHHKPTHSPKKSKAKSRKEDSSGAIGIGSSAGAGATSSTTIEPKSFQTINPSLSRPPFWVIEEETSGGSSIKNFHCLPLLSLTGLIALLWLPGHLCATQRRYLPV